MANETEQLSFEFEPRKTIKGYPELHWTGKRPFISTVYYPAQLKESYGEGKPYTDRHGKTSSWFNKIFWGDNLQVMSHLLKEFRSQIDLIYIDPPFDSAADYSKKIKLRGKVVKTDNSIFEEKQYGDIWTNDEYLQFMYERLILIKELLSKNGVLFLHCDYRKSHHLRSLIDEIFGVNNLQNEVIWCYRGMAVSTNHFVRRHDNILFASKTQEYTFNWELIAEPLEESTIKKYRYIDKDGRKFRLHGRNITGSPIQNNTDIDISWLEKEPNLCRIDYLDDKAGSKPRDWFIMDYINVMSNERENYPTQKPEVLLERLIKVATNSGDLVFDCFMGSGTTQAVAMKLGRRFIGADINLGAIQTTTKRLINIAKDTKLGDERYTSFEVYNVNNYEIFRNPLEARNILLQALEVEPFESTSVYDGEKDGRMIKIMPDDVNRIATKADIKGFIANLPYKVFERKREENPNELVLKLTVICMGHEPDLKAAIEQALHKYKVDIEVVDILTDRKDLQFKRDAQGEIAIENSKLVIKSFYPLNLMQKLSMQRENVEEWRQLVESIMIDFNYDGAILSPTVIDTPNKNEFVQGIYDIPKNSGKIKVKIIDLLSESLELETEVK